MQYRLALVTGASAGLGREICRLLASKGIPLFITGRDQKRLDEAAAELHPQISYAADLGDKKARARLVELIRYHAPDLIINNAGFGLYGDALSHSTEEQLEILEVNGNAVLEITLEAARTLQKKNHKGTVLNVSSAAAFFIYPTFAVYAASKALVNQFSRSLDAELKLHGIRVLTVCPGKIDTPFRERASKGHVQKSKDGHTMRVERVAALIWDQIEKQKSFAVIDWRYRLGTMLRHFVPQKYLEKILRKSLADRIPER